MAKQLSPSAGPKRTLGRLIKHRNLLIMMAPAVVLYILFRYLPIYGVIIAFKDYKFNLGIMGSPWVGFANFEKLFKLSSFRGAVQNTLILSFLKLLFGFPAPILLAIMINEVRGMRFKRTVQTISYLPHFISWVILAGIFMQFLSPSTGPINILLRSMGIEPIYFLGENKWFRTVLVATSVWKSVGWSSIVYLAAMGAIDTELYESAWVDGAGRLKRIWHITLPGITPTITIMLILAIGAIVNDDFDQVFNLYNTSVLKVGDVISTYTYRMGLVDNQYSRSAAVGLIRNVIALMLVVSANAVARRINDYSLF